MLKDWDELLKENGYAVEGEYCEVCQQTDGEQRYLVDGVTICYVCLIDGKRQDEFPSLVDMKQEQEYKEEKERDADIYERECFEREHGPRKDERW